MKIVLPPELRDITAWPTVSEDQLQGPNGECLRRRMAAIKAYVSGATHRQIRHDFGIRKGKLLRLFHRCLEAHLDGRIWGFRACRYYARIRRYERRADSPAERGVVRSGHSGLLQRLFDRFPHLLADLIERCTQSRNKVFTESSLRMDRIHARFLDQCRAAGIKGHEYPFNVESLAARSLRTFLKEAILRRSLRATVSVRFGEDAARRLGADGESPRIGAKYCPYGRVEVDGHRVDLHTVVELIDPKGGEPVVLPLERFWLLVAIETTSRAVLGYHISLNRHYTAEDVLRCLENSILPWKPMELQIPGLAYAEGGGFPSGVIPELACAVWGELAFDNDKSNLSKWVWERVQTKIGCSLNPGPIKTPEARQFVERFFRSFEENGFQLLPSTSGSNSKDPRRKDPEEKALKHRIRFEEIVELTDVLIANYNATATSALHGRSPLEYLRFSVERNSFFVRSMPLEERERFTLTVRSVTATVRGNISKGIRPSVQVFGVRYYGPRLISSAGLIGKRLLIEVNTRDLRQVRAFLENGDEFETLTAARAWAGTPHDLQTRLAILRHARKARLDLRHIPDAVGAYVEFKSREKRTKKENNKLVRTLMLSRPKPGFEDPIPVKPLPRPRTPPSTSGTTLFTQATNY